VTPEARFGFCAVEIDMRDCAMAAEESAKVVGDLAVVLDHRVQAATAHAGVQHVPDGDARCFEGLNFLPVRRERIDFQKLTDDAPKGVLLVGVVPAGLQRGASRHAAQDQHPRAPVRDRGEAADARLAQGA